MSTATLLAPRSDNHTPTLNLGIDAAARVIAATILPLNPTRAQMQDLTNDIASMLNGSAIEIDMTIDGSSVTVEIDNDEEIVVVMVDGCDIAVFDTPMAAR